MSDDLATAIASAALQEPAPTPPALQSVPEFSGATYTFNLREALTDLRFTVNPSIEQAAFSAVLCVAIADDGRIVSAVAKADDPRWYDEAAVAQKALRMALEGMGIKAN